MHRLVLCASWAARSPQRCILVCGTRIARISGRPGARTWICGAGSRHRAVLSWAWRAAAICVVALRAGCARCARWAAAAAAAAVVVVAVAVAVVVVVVVVVAVAAVVVWEATMPQ